MVKHPQKLGQMIFAAVFFCSVIGYGALNLWYAKEPLAENVQEAWDNIREEPAAETVVSAVADLDTAVTENTLFRYPLLECYGGMQLALGKHEENAFDVVKDKDGYLHGGNFWTGFGDDTKELAVRVRRLADAMEERGTKVGFVLPPMKVVRQQAAYTGIPYNDFTEQADSLLRWLRYYSVPYLDLRESLKDDNLSYEETYYKTDHHWSPLAAFAGFRDTVEWMNFQWNAGLDPAGDFRDLSPVSYTHLDVYKRQVHGYLDLRRSKREFPFNFIYSGVFYFYCLDSAGSQELNQREGRWMNVQS